MKSVLCAVIGAMFLWAYAHSDALACDKSSINKCLMEAAEIRGIEIANIKKEFAFNPNNSFANLNNFLEAPIATLNTTTRSDDLLQLTPLTWRYRRSLLLVIPQETAQIKRRLIETISALPIVEQIEWLKDIAILEFFSGDTARGLNTIKHAKIKKPKNTHVALIHYLLHELAPAIEQIIKETGFDRSSCWSAEKSSTTSIASLLSSPHKKLQEHLKSLPDQQLRLKIYFLISELLQTTNECNFQYRFYDYQLYWSITEIKNQGEFIKTSIKAAKSYQYFGNN
ncbi:MAG: hypothetical protein MI976_01260 [Pseudomonadales bacterium]|nr:hypothetical protein [Pseudomonadales bacterium]